MLQLRPNCEYCNCDLAPNSVHAMICSYECTFCRACVESKLHNVCPNCGGGFVERPIRPNTAYRAGVSLNQQPASEERVNTKYSADEIADFVDGIHILPPASR